MARDRDFRRSGSEPPEDPVWQLPETQLDAAGLLREIIRMTPRSDERRDYLLLLLHQLETDTGQLEEARQAITEFEEAYAKLTSPAHRLGVYLGAGPEDGTALVAVGDQEYVANVDPMAAHLDLQVGTRVRVNDAFTVIGEIGPHPGGALLKVSEVLDEARLRVGIDAQGAGAHVVFRAEALLGVRIADGDEVRTDPAGKVALEHFAAKGNRDFFLEDVPELPWSAIGGQEEAIQVIKDAIELPLLHPELFVRFEKRPPRGILLFGPPGCGKTLIGKATAWNLTREYRERTGRDVQETFLYINGPKILNMWLGETERMVREIFSTAREKASAGNLVFIFIDEAESILRTRSSGRWMNISNTVVPQFCAEMDGLVSLNNVVVLLSSNRPDYIDPAIIRPERIDRKVKVARPNRAAARDILGIYLHPTIPLDPALIREHKGDACAARDELLDLAVDQLWRVDDETRVLEVFLRSGSAEMLYWRDLVSGALLRSVVERAKDFAIKRSIAADVESGITLNDITEALRIEYRENEIFPRGDNLDDWLKLLDLEPDNVATVRPTRGRNVGGGVRRSVI